MSQQSSFTSFCKDVLTFTSLSVVAVMSVPYEVFSLSTEIANEKKQLETNLLTNKLDGKESNFLLAGKDKDDDDDDDDDDDRKNNYRRGDDDDDDDDNYHRDEYRKVEYHRSSKFYRVRDWDCFFKVGRLNSNRKALVVQLDILKKPVTKYANVVYKVYARQNNQWVLFYTSTGARLIEKQSGKFFLQPEVIEYDKLRINNLNLSQSDIRFVTEIRYDSNSSRDERIVFEDVWKYSSITQITSVTQITKVSYRSTKIEYDRDNYRRREDDDDRDNYRRRDDDDDDRRREYRQVNNLYSSKKFRSKDWDCVFKVGRLVNSNQRAFVVDLDIREKPFTKDANVVYIVYARQNNRWVQFYSSSTKIVTKNPQPEIRAIALFNSSSF
ncbi:hypothetical protein A0J48_016115 [Sphaerospermopsis aphanizomenoides BCCUSP55]|uniref:hypothetical protein n=1 Tax=Sphaerospermopsis aphanizomenoides TaxID=459663 RepID=UPI001908C3C2|nr:hypothetical protein [Sphaerospermopsis aphanizomenoides]MBK1989046.1 hypothetical protein [Sphaerospermopsis aphanizomenoides BCCUSP55]